MDGVVSYRELIRVFKDSDSNQEYDGNGGCPVYPIVILKPEVQLNGDTNFYTETATATITNPTQTEKYSYEHTAWTIVTE